jgi:two-component system response regulator DesR
MAPFKARNSTRRGEDKSPDDRHPRSLGICVVARDGLKRLVNDQDEMEVAAEAGDGRKAVRLAISVRPSIASVDVSVPGWDGIRLSETMSEACPNVRVHRRHPPQGEQLRSADDGGRCAWLRPQAEPFKELTRAIGDVAWGSEYVDGGIASPVIAPTRSQADILTKIGPEAELSHPEEQVLRLLAHAHTLQGIGQPLGIALGQVADLKGTAMRKAGLATRVHSMKYGDARGWR